MVRNVLDRIDSFAEMTSDFCGLRVKSPFIATSVGSAVLEVLNPFAIAISAACAFLSLFSKRTSASKTSTKITARYAEKICSRPDNLRKTCPVDTQFMLIAFGSWLASTTVVLSVRRL